MLLLFKIIPVLSALAAIFMVFASLFLVLRHNTLLTKLVLLGFSCFGFGLLFDKFYKTEEVLANGSVLVVGSATGIIITAIGFFVGSFTLCLFMYKEYKNN